MRESGSLSAQQDTQFRRDGYVVARQVYTPDEVAELRDTFMRVAANGPVEGLSETQQALSSGTTEPYSPSDPLRFYPRMLHPHNHPDKPVGPLSMKYMLHPKLEPLLATLFGEEPVAVQSMFYFKPPQARGQALHQDNFYLRVKPGTCIAGWVALDDADVDNGGIVCVPNTHSYPIQCPEQSDLKESFTTEYVTPPAGSRAELVPLKAGDVLFFNGNMIHGSGPNLSKTRFRRAFICHYVPRHTIELSHWYTTTFRFNREQVSIPVATGGGPCGNSAEGGWQPAAPH
jgi:ectoine hydroxylase-related dioxygenase (phytanoyl-CoA dioxygenase family)